MKRASSTLPSFDLFNGVLARLQVEFLSFVYITYEFWHAAFLRVTKSAVFCVSTTIPHIPTWPQKALKGSPPDYTGGHQRVSVAQGQKVVPSPAVSSAMCRMWVIFKEAQALAFDMKHQQCPRQKQDSISPHLSCPKGVRRGVCSIEVALSSPFELKQNFSLQDPDL
ncbi:hypothetical protein F7725_019473 [Dissostichus mawsoni]|uniref:Uncharacterized protein n=1 Tax=Dissostichus mawsoni TaxID=36200 RepID=A0A7J5YJU3_DISMA|nr:hypothetical protein F7725_019473 [Dissostichus mawsoni]